jgi:hypothetical protein
MKHTALTALFLLSLTASPFAANLVVNGGFEDPITYDGPPFVGLWEGFNGGGASAANSTALPYAGLQSLKLSIASTVNTFAGAFQDVPGLTSGTEYTFGGWHTTTSSPLNLGVEVRIEWRNSVSGNEVGRTPNLTPIPGAIYLPFSLTTAVPVGADTARLVYAVQSFSTAPLGDGTVYLDEVSFSVVPEPSSALLLGVGCMALIALRQRRI